ncbi:MAG: carbohydrate ABC transporter permease [Candidatus Theseobacter exili]|nr:carbohydrate ABC transporter permease [Candidatus Theseobacter exili]
MSTVAKSVARRVGIHLFLFFVFVITIVPFLWMISTSFKSSEGIFAFPPKFIPVNPTLEHYKDLFEKVKFLGHFKNSLIIAVSITLLNLFFNSLAGYAFAKYKFPGREKIFTLLLVTMMVPGQVAMMPVFLILKNLGLLNTYLGLIIPGASGVFGIFLMRQFMKTIPNDLIESARIDGCSEFRIFWSIMLPLCKPALATLAIFTFMGAWNEFIWPLIIMTKEEMYTLPVALANLNGQHNTEWGLLMAGSVIIIIPILVTFIALQRYFMKGIVLTGLKG